MTFKITEKLIHEASSPKGLLYRVIIAYACCSVILLIGLSVVIGHLSRINLYFVINISTVLLLTWFIRKSFNILSRSLYISSFRVSLFLLLNSSLASMAGGLGVIEYDVASLIAAILYFPAIISIIASFNVFIEYVNQNYTSAISLSLTDDLTGLPNRRHMNNKFKELEDSTATIGIADIDFFKKINDTYGHDTGDAVLKNTASLLKKFIDERVFICRSGGEEFVIIIYDNINIEEILNTIKNSISDENLNDIKITMSIGVARKQKNASITQVISAADKALYEAKKAGRNCIVYANHSS